MTVLSRRALNRALLQRQFLLERTDQAPLDVIRRLVALQAQEPNWPYLGLWSRIRGFTCADLTTLLAGSQVVRSSLLRGTQHIAAADDFRRLRPLLQPVLDRTANSAYFRRNRDQLSIETLLADGRALLDAGPLARKALARCLAARHPGHDGRILAGEVELRTPLIHDPATASWGSWGNRSSITVTAVAVDTVEPTAIRELIRRYLAAFGPATVADGDLRIVPFRPLPAADQQALDDEASRLLPVLKQRESPERVIADGREAIDATVAAARSQLPGMAFGSAAPVDGHPR